MQFWQPGSKFFAKSLKMFAQSSKMIILNNFFKILLSRSSSGNVEFGFDNPAEHLLL